MRPYKLNLKPRYHTLSIKYKYEVTENLQLCSEKLQDNIDYNNKALIVISPGIKLLQRKVENP